MDAFVKQEFSPEVEREERDKAALLEEMGLEGREVEKLKATLLSPSEAVAAKNEELLKIRQHKGQKKNWYDFIDEKARRGKTMASGVFLRRLKGICPGLIWRPAAQKNRLSLYVIKNVPADEIAGYRGSYRWIDCPIYAGWIELGDMPEFEIDLVNDANIAVGQRRGWRTILLRLATRRTKPGDPLGTHTVAEDIKYPSPFIREIDVDRVFGYCEGPSASYYRRQMYEFRNGR